MNVNSLAQLECLAAGCEACPNLVGPPVLSSLNGSVPARIMFVAEAPGRLGACLSRVPLFGDATGRNFDLLLASCGLLRADAFITNCVLCNPRDDQGRNRRPTALETKSCTRLFMDAQIGLADPELVLTLGGAALASLEMLEPHGLTLADVGRVVSWHGRLLAPLFHPSPRVVNTRRRIWEQTADLRRALALSASFKYAGCLELGFTIGARATITPEGPLIEEVA
jgi:uracil-DNA glycosylase